jgi:hypothetical protein
MTEGKTPTQDRAARAGANGGEGSQSGARAYNEATKRCAGSGKAGPTARDAARALEGKEDEALRQAEREGARHSRGEDPALKR